MITYETAKFTAQNAVSRLPCWLPSDDELVLVDEATLERPWGWVFFYTSRKWAETGDLQYALAGNAPILVERTTGRLLTLGTARPVEDYIAAYERSGDPHA